MNRSRILVGIASGLLACALVVPAAGQRKRPLRTVPSDAARQWLDALTAEAIEPSIGGVPTNGSAATIFPPSSSVQPGQPPRVNGQNSALPHQPDSSARTPRALKPKLSRLEKAKALWQVGAGFLLLPAGLQNTLQSAQAAAQYPGQSLWKATPVQPSNYYAGQTYASAAPQRDYPAATALQATGYPALSPVGFRRIQSPDGIVSMQIPGDWQARPPFGQNYGAVSPRGESFSCGKVDVFMDAASMRAAAQALQMKGAPPQQLAFLPRLVSAPLAPDQIVVRLLPQISGGAIENVQIIGARRLPDGGAAIAYRYVLLPQRDRLSGALLPPALMRESQVPMQAEIYIQPASGIPFGAVRTWSFLYSSVSAPRAIYSRNATVYAAMFQSLSVNGGAMHDSMARDQQLTQSLISGMQDQQRIVDGFTSRYRQNSEQQLNQFRDFNTRTGNLWIDMAGQQSPVKDPNDPNWGGYVQWGSQPGNTRAVHCWLVSSDPVFVDITKPTPNGCNDVVPDYR